MFRRLSEPLPLSEASLLALRPAMNTPVLNAGFLPVAPARAAVIAFAEEYGGIGIALGLRSSDSGQLVILRNQESIDFDVPLDVALEPLFAEAERMGFLFDEDMLATGGPGRAAAMAHWAELMGGLDRLVPPPAPPPIERTEHDAEDCVGPLSPSQAIEETQYPELMLDDVAPFTLDEDEGPDAPESTFEEPRERVALAKAGSDDATEAIGSGGGGALDGQGNAEGEADADESLEIGLDDALGRAGIGALEEDADALDSLDDPLLDAWAQGRPEAAVPEAKPAPRVARLAPLVQVAVGRANTPLVERSAPVSAPVPSPAASPAPAPVAAVPTELPAVVPETDDSEDAAPVRPSASVLSKFRPVERPARSAATGPSKSEVGRDRSAELARIPIVRVRKSRPVDRRPPLLTRLLASF